MGSMLGALKLQAAGGMGCESEWSRDRRAQEADPAGLQAPLYKRDSTPQDHLSELLLTGNS